MCVCVCVCGWYFFLLGLVPAACCERLEGGESSQSLCVLIEVVQSGLSQPMPCVNMWGWGLGEEGCLFFRGL